MKFLLDMNMPPSLIPMLENLGHEYNHINLLGFPTMADDKILDLAEMNNQIILTHDLDFGTLLAVTARTKPSVIIFRIHKINAEKFYLILKDNIEIISSALEEGSLVIFESINIRIRKLPIRKSG